MPKNSLVITSTVVDTLGGDKLPQSGWVEFSDGKYYHWIRTPGGEAEFRISTRSRPYEGAAWKYRFFKSPARVALLVAELGV